jgi:hypothetical protein
VRPIDAKSAQALRRGRNPRNIMAADGLPSIGQYGSIARTISITKRSTGIAASADQHVRRSLTDAARELSMQLGFVDTR